jgi:two-component system capsular synthesis response regulator RcsB
MVRLRVILADDHPFVLLGVRSTLVAFPDIAVVGEAQNPTELIRLLHTTPCDVLVTDLTMPDPQGGMEDGLSMLRRIRRDWPSIKIVILTNLTNAAILHSIMTDGTVGMLSKMAPLEQLEPAIRAAAEGSAHLIGVNGDTSAKAGENEHMPLSIPSLSSRQSEVLRMFVSGRSISEIAIALGRDRRTVSRQKRDAMAKLRVTNDPGLFAYARAHGWV